MSKKKVNPWAVCKAQAKKTGMSKEKLERCIRKVKRKSGFKRSKK